MSSALVVETREIDPIEDLLAAASPDRPLAWLRRGDGIVAVGEPLRELRTSSGVNTTARDMSSSGCTYSCSNSCRRSRKSGR